MSYSQTTNCSIPASALGESAVVPSGDRGFSLVELILVVALVSILVSIALPSYSKIKDKVREVRCSSEIRELERRITAFSIDQNGAPPTSWVAMGIAAPLDPWGRAYEIGVPFREDLATTVNTDFDLYSKGQDGLSDQDIEHANSRDDVIRAGNGGFVGLVQNMLP